MSLASLPAATEATELYFQALHECDLDKFDRVFHPSASLFDTTGGHFTAMPIAPYHTIIEHRRPPPQSANPETTN